MPLDIHLVAHTHWDREWYHTAEVFRQRLVELVDEILDAPPGEGESFLLDGQAIVLADYLAVRPDRRDRLSSLLREGRIEAGPWYVLSDELIPGGEALIRNLLAGRALLNQLGATAPPVLYCPDSFGHPATLPEIARGFGFPLIVLWRGYGGKRWPRGDVVRWRAPSGAEALVFHLPPDGYEFGSSLPVDPAGAAERWEHIRGTLAPRSTVGVTLLQNGADHHARQRGAAAAFRELRELAEKSKDRIRVSSLRQFAAALVSRADAQRVQPIKGELRDSYGYTWTLQGTFGTRAAQKRANAIAERALIRVAEPWSAMAWFLEGVDRRHLVQAAWRTLLETHPHDTLCGTSVDPVAAAADQRIESAYFQSSSIAAAAASTLLRRDGDAEHVQPDAWQSVVVVRNDASRSRDGVFIFELIEKLSDERVGPNSAGGPQIDELAAQRKSTVSLPRGMQLLGARTARERIESPRHYPDNDIVRVLSIASSIGNVPAFSLSSFSTPGPVPGAVSDPVKASADELSNAIVRCRFGKSGGVAIESGQRTATNAIRFEDRIDRGDLYTPSIGGTASVIDAPKRKIVHRGPLVGEVRQSWKVKPAAKRGRDAGSVEVALRLTAGSPLLEVFVEGVNAATNHRLRIGIATGIADGVVVADAAFGPILRVPLDIPAADRLAEQPPLTAPLHRYLSVFSPTAGATVYSDGLAEYEVDAKGVVWITLVRAVGDLSRNDLDERPGHAGWPVDTPDAQSIGPFEARFALLLHGAKTPATVAQIEAESDRFLHPLRGTTIRSALSVPARVAGPELSGPGLAMSAIKQSEDGEWLVLRCLNLLDREQTGQWRLPRSIHQAKLARIDETPTSDIAVNADGRSVTVVAGPRAVVTLLVR